VTGPVRPPTPADQAWAQLAADLTPAKSLARIDAVTARAVTTITIIGLLLTGLGAFAAGLPNALGEPATALAVATVITAALAVASALAAQLLTITRRLNPANLADVRAWYRRQFELRAYPTQAATLLLLAAALLAGATAAAALLATPATAPTLTVTQTLQPGPSGSTSPAQASATVSVTFRGLAPGQVATLTLATPGAAGALGRAAATAAPDGTATLTLTAGALTTAQPVTLTAVAPGQICQATLTPARAQPALTCHTGLPNRPVAQPQSGSRTARDRATSLRPAVTDLQLSAVRSAVAIAARRSQAHVRAANVPDHESARLLASERLPKRRPHPPKLPIRRVSAGKTAVQRARRDSNPRPSA
jgi:hypothetical protein